MARRAWGETYPLVVDDLDNGSELAGVWASGEENDTADLDQSPLGRLDLSVTHYARCVVRSEEWRVSDDVSPGLAKRVDALC